MFEIKKSISFETLLLRKNSFVNISKTCVFAFIFNVCIKSSTISAIKNVRCASIYIDFFATNEDNNNKKKAISFCVVALVISIIKKCKDYILNLASREFVFFFSSNANNIN